jgi:uncharacterized membrane protein YkvI
MSKKIVVPPYLGVAAVWFSTHSGPGFASGRQEATYYVKYGKLGLVLPILAMAILGIGVYYCLEFTRQNKTYDFKSFADKIYSPYEKVFSALFEFSFLMTLCTAGGAVLAGAGSLMQQALNMPYWLGVGSISIILLILSIFGASLVRKSASILTICIIVIVSIVTIIGIKAGAPNLPKVMALPEYTNVSVWDGIKSAILYASFQATVFANLTSVAQELKTRKDSLKAAITGIILNSFMLIMVCTMLLSFAPNSMDQTLPVYYVVTQLKMPWLCGLFSVLYYIALTGTGTSFIFSGITRYEKFFTFIKNEKVRKISLSVIIIICLMGVSSFGLKEIVAKGFSLLGIINIFVILVPVIVLGSKKIKVGNYKVKE